MFRAIISAGLAVLGSCAVFAQTAGQPSFEVASIKPAGPMPLGRMMVRMGGGPGTPDPGQITYTNVSIKNVMMNAYNVKGYQISGPDWLESQRFDIMAKVPQGTTQEQFRLMLQNLLAERFKLTLHHQSKDLPMYALVVGKGGHKMKESEDPAPGSVPNAGGPNGAPPPPDGAFGRGAGGGPVMGKDGFPRLPPGGRGAIMMMGMNGKMRMQMNGQTMSGLVDMLANQLGRPVVDMTELKARYDIILEFAPDEGQMPMMRGVMPPPGAVEGGGGPGGGAASPDGQSGPTIFSAVQEQLGLKLEARKGPVDLLVIDNLEKVPTEN